MAALGQIHALLQIQILTLLNSFRHNAGRSGLKISVALASLWYGFWVFSAVGCAVLPSLVGIEDVEKVLPGVLLFIMCYWQLAPLLTLSLGVSLDIRRMSVYPVSLPTLFFVECLLRLGTGVEMMLLLAGFLGGLALAGSSHGAGIATAFVLFVAFNVFVSAGVRNLVERVFHQRRLREFLLILLVCGTLLPQLLIWSATARELGRLVLTVLQEFPLWVLPSDVAAKIASEPFEVERAAVLAAMVLVAGAFGFWQFQSGYLLASAPSYPAVSRGNAANRRWRMIDRIARGPSILLPDPIGALVEKEIKSLWRSPRFRLPFFMGFTFGVIAWVPLMRQWPNGWGGWMEQSAVALVSLYAFLLLGPVMFLNRFGFDRSASRSYFWMPLSLAQLLVAKNLATVALASFEVALVALVCRLVGLTVGLTEIAEAATVSLIALLYLLSVGNYMSVRFPVASNPDRISRSGPGHGLRATVQFLLFPLSLVPLGAAFWVRYGAANPSLFATFLAVAGVLGLGLYVFTLSAMARLAEGGREEFLSHLTQGEGPVATE